VRPTRRRNTSSLSVPSFPLRNCRKTLEPRARQCRDYFLALGSGM
jgi:hypothetical protein